MRDNVVERLFSLFTSPDRAEAMAGDLVQERHDRGPGWFWWQTTVTIVSLWATAVGTAPFRTMLVAAFACALFVMPAFAGVAAVGLFPTLFGALAAWSLLSIFWWGGALWTGASIVGVSRARGIPACVTVVALGEMLLLTLWIAGVRLDFLSVTSAAFYVTAAAAACPLLVGAAIARDRAIGRSTTSLEQHA